MISISRSPASTAPGQGKLSAIVLRCAAVASLGGILFGFDTAVIAGATQALRQLFSLTPSSLGLTVAIALWGTILGAMLAGYPGDLYGRRDSLRGLAVLFFVSAIGCSLAWSWLSFVVFRFIAGLAIGGSSVLGPMYIAEISPARWRGRLVCFFQFSIVLGILVAYLSNYLISTLHLQTIEWRWQLGVSAAPAILFFVCLFFIPRSPRWLATKGRLTEAAAVLDLVGKDSEDELAKIVESVQLDRSAGKERLFQKRYRRPILLAVAVGMFNQLAGINSILYYVNDIFARAGFNRVSGSLQAIVIGCTNLFFTMIAMTVIDKVGRRKLLLWGSVGMCICLSACFQLLRGRVHENLLIVPLIGYIACFAFSQGAVIWVYISEIFPNRVRSKGQSLGSFSHWFMTAVLTWIFPILSAHSAAAPFAFFASMMVLQFFIVLVFFPETKGVPLEDLESKLGIQ